MVHWRKLLAALAVGPLLALPARALDWNTKSLTVATVPFQATLEASFEFRNNSAKPVRVRDVESSCDCLDADTELKVYAPGEKGVVRATFTVGDRTGLYERSITVVTDEADSPVRLRLQVEVPIVAELAPRSVSWRLNETAAEKSIELTPAQGLEVVFAEAQPTNAAFTVRLETLTPGRYYRLRITPAGTDRPASAAIRIFGREKTGHDVVISAYASVE